MHLINLNKELSYYLEKGEAADLRYAEMLKKDIADARAELDRRIKSKKGTNEAKQEDPTDIIAMDVPLFLRMLEYAREDAEQDIDLHKVTERAIEAVKLRGLLSMEDYQDIVGEPLDEMTGYSKYLSTPENPKGKTQGLTQDVMDKILLKIATMGDDDREETIRLGEGLIEEELCAKGKAYRKRRIAAGEKSSAYLSGRAVKVCKGQMSGKKKKVNEESDARNSAIQAFEKMPIGKVIKTTKGDFKKIEADKFENISTKVKYNSAQMSYTTPSTK
jgi:hypothetical protein